MKWKKTILSLSLLLFLLLPVQALELVKHTPEDRSPEAIFSYLEKAVQLIQKHGPRAYEEITDPNGPWVEGDWYLHINNFDGYSVAHVNKNYVGIRFFAIRDIKGNAFFAELQKEAMNEEGRGWVEYWWPKLHEIKPSRKIGFVMRVPGKRLWIGTGLYDMSDEEVKRLREKQFTK